MFIFDFQEYIYTFKSNFQEFPKSNLKLVEIGEHVRIPVVARANQK